jgi:hypothetical protein
MALLTLTEYKAIKGITTSDNDTKLTAIISAVLDEIRGTCGYDDDEELPDALKLTAVRMVEYKDNEISGIKSQSFEGNSVSFATECPKSITTALNRYRRIRYV